MSEYWEKVFAFFGKMLRNIEFGSVQDLENWLCS